MTSKEIFDDNIHSILKESALKEHTFSIFDFASSDDPKPEDPEKENDTLKTAMVESIQEIEDAGEGLIDRFPPGIRSECQTFFMPSDVKAKFETICKNNYTTPSCFLRNVCSRLVESYYGRKDN